ncbi:MAG: GNAT family N-acetyltransferase [Flavobacteriales bacterium]|nr:GNAT family N-acetyltransferase [Flavobacteriales bacterium]
MSGYTIHKLERENFPLLIPLMQDCFGMEVDITYFEWKFKDNPSGFAEGFYAKDEKGEVAAYYGVIPETYVINGEKRVIYQSCDTMTHSNHRRKGLFRMLAMHCYDLLREQNKLFIIGFGGGESTPGFLKFGWKEIFKVRYYFYPKLLTGLSGRDFSMVEEVSDLGVIEHLTLKSNEHAQIHSFKNKEIFCWRTSNPLHVYKTIAVKDGSEYCSYLTYYKQKDKLILFDFYADPSGKGRQLFNYLKAAMGKDTKGIVAFLQENSLQSRLLKKYGFIRNPFNRGPLHERVPFIFYASENEMEQFDKSTFWAIHSFDHDAL